MSSTPLNPAGSMKLIELEGHMYTNAHSAYKRALINAERLGHGAAGNAHLLLGILALGNSDQYTPIPRILRELGADYRTLYEFLEERTELCAEVPASLDITINRSALQTLIKASRISRRRARRDDERNAIITSDLLIAVLNANDSLVQEALRHMGVNEAKIRLRLENSRPIAPASQPSRPTHLRPVSN